MNGHSEVRESQAAEDSQKDCLVSERQMRVGFHNTEGLHTMTGGHRKILVIAHIIGPAVRICCPMISQLREG